MANMARSAASLPLYTLDLARRYWAPLLFVYLAGTLVHRILLRGVAWVGLQSPVLGLLALSVTVLVTLATTIIMFLLLRPGLPVLDHELTERSRRARGGQEPERPDFAERERRIVDAVAMSLLPFLIFYSAWGLFVDELRRYAALALNEAGVSGYTFVFDINPFGLPLLVLMLAFVARTVCEHFFRRTNSKVLGLSTALFETVLLFFVVMTIAEILGQIRAWFESRLVWLELQAAVSGLLDWLTGITTLPFSEVAVLALAALGWLWELLKDGLIQPLLWLTIAAVVFGADVDRTEALFRPGSTARQMQEAALAHTPGLVKRLSALAGRGLREKYLPFLNAFRFILQVSPIYYLSFCLYYTLLELGFGWLERGVYLAVGPADFLGWWWPWLGPIEIAVTALHELLRVCLLAATFEIALRRIASREPGRRGKRARV